MKSQDFLLVVVGAAIGAAIGTGAIYYFSFYQQIVAPRERLAERLMAVEEMETVRVLVAKETLSAGMLLDTNDLQWVDWPKQAVPPGAFTSVEALLGERRDQRRTVLQSIERGEPILDAKIMRLGQSLALAVSPAEGMRAVSVRIDGASSELQKLSAGDRVDVFLVRLLKEQPVESLILQDIRILAIAEPQTADAELASTDRQVAFELDEGVQEQKLLLAQQVGQLVIKER